MPFSGIEKSGEELITNNQDIVKYLGGLQAERDSLGAIIDKQYEERKKIEAEIEKLTYKLCLVNKSLSSRIRAKNNYDKTIDEIRIHYDRLVEGSSQLRQILMKTQTDLDSIMNKKIGTDQDEGHEVKMLYARSGVQLSTASVEQDECNCHTNSVPSKVETPPRQKSTHEAPTKESKHSSFRRSNEISIPSGGIFENPSDKITKKSDHKIMGHVRISNNFEEEEEQELSSTHTKKDVPDKSEPEANGMGFQYATGSPINENHSRNVLLARMRLPDNCGCFAAPTYPKVKMDVSSVLQDNGKTEDQNHDESQHHRDTVFEDF